MSFHGVGVVAVLLLELVELVVVLAWPAWSSVRVRTKVAVWVELLGPATRLVMVVVTTPPGDCVALVVGEGVWLPPEELRLALVLALAVGLAAALEPDLLLLLPPSVS